MSRKHRLPGIVQTIPIRVVDRLFARYTTTADGCWISDYSVGSHGYSQIGWQEGGELRMITGHRAAWIAVNGSIDEGLTVDHICRVRRCINPAHLRLLSNVDNARDNGYSSRTHCVHGHEYTPGNTYSPPSNPTHRRCRTCAQARNRRAA